MNETCPKHLGGNKRSLGNAPILQVFGPKMAPGNVQLTLRQIGNKYIPQKYKRFIELAFSTNNNYWRKWPPRLDNS